MSTNDERAKDAEALAVLDDAAKTLYSEFAASRAPHPGIPLFAARAHLAARLESLAGEAADARQSAARWSDECAAADAGRSLAIARAESAERERDALAAELARMREALERIHAHGYTTTNDYEMVRAALAAKPKGEL